MTGIAILGSTGSIGCNTLKVIEHLGGYRVVTMAAGRNIEKLAEQVAKFQPELVSVDGEQSVEELERSLRAAGISLPKIVHGSDGLIAAATHEKADIF